MRNEVLRLYELTLKKNRLNIIAAEKTVAMLPVLIPPYQALITTGIIKRRYILSFPIIEPSNSSTVKAMSMSPAAIPYVTNKSFILDRRVIT